MTTDHFYPRQLHILHTSNSNVCSAPSAEGIQHPIAPMNNSSVKNLL